MLEETGLRVLEAAPNNKIEPGKGLQLTKLDQTVEQWTGGRINVARVSVFLVVGAGIAFKIARSNQVSAAPMLLLYGGRAAQRWWLSSKEGREITIRKRWMRGVYCRAPAEPSRNSMHSTSSVIIRFVP